MWQPVSEVPKYNIVPLFVGHAEGHARRARLRRAAQRLRRGLRVGVRRASDRARVDQAGHRASRGHPLGRHRVLRAHRPGQLGAARLRHRASAQRARRRPRALVRHLPDRLLRLGGRAPRRARARTARRRSRSARRRSQALLRVVLPAAAPGIAAAVVLGFGRAIGETMIVVLASGNAALARLRAWGTSTRTVTATIAQELGEVVVGSAHYHVLFFLGALLFLSTLARQPRRRAHRPRHAPQARRRS